MEKETKKLPPDELVEAMGNIANLRSSQRGHKLAQAAVNYAEEEKNAFIHSNRNKLSRITYLISVLENERFNSLLPKAIESAKQAVNELAYREVYEPLKNHEDGRS